ncbi:TetR/AcrR family transcriptional regulator [Neoroseomonas oryzicola]|uniref:TetR/AcrR family transcriptional regulator n=1 Tax=Neoroseomonas oryzicola TaxID=535904 RepID=A0A9X9WGA0_9PROT|nr:TetR/AcrR family transcriptional regulator [Neoroseomonas oryzicola]MBR0659360.1 TetR/AcrR family transcriptional regulator [Neoroseomonas oryzicola]NKE16261.1 TetR/AcrR family transcriptional regulator [Neoroseomonas oryzicola]
MKQPASVQEDRAAATRERILDAAWDLFRTLGYQKTAVADIAREIGMSPANVYRFFASKSAINEAIAARLLEGVAGDLESIAAGSGSAADRLKAVLRTLHARHLALFFSQKRMHDMVSAAMTEHWGVVAAFIARIEAALARIVADGIAAGDFAPVDPATAARMMKQGTMCWMHPELIADALDKRVMDEAQMAAELEQMLDLLIRGLRPDS